MSHHWSEPPSPAKPNLAQRLTLAALLFATSTVAFGLVSTVDMSIWNIWLAGATFLLALATIVGAVGAAFAHCKVGLVVGLLLGAIYFANLFLNFGPNGGHHPDVPGWPITITLDQ